MARASSSNTKFASVNLNKSYGKPAAASTSGSLSSGNAVLGGASGGRARASSGMLLLSRPVRPLQQQPGGGGAGAANVPPKSGKVIVPRPVNLPSLRREHAGNDPTIALVGGTGASGWTKTQQQEELPVATVPETTTSGMARNKRCIIVIIMMVLSVMVEIGLLGLHRFFRVLVCWNVFYQRTPSQWSYDCCHPIRNPVGSISTGIYLFYGGVLVQSPWL
jgi:hypothetical protein